MEDEEKLYALIDGGESYHLIPLDEDNMHSFDDCCCIPSVEDGMLIHNQLFCGRVC